MANIDSLPPDQRAVLQLVLQRGRSYDQIADLLSIDRAAVRQRALYALEALTPAASGSAPSERSLITDYLLRQLPSGVSDQVHALLATSSADNAWARAISRELARFDGSLAEVPELRAPEADAAVRGPQATNSADTDLPTSLDEPQPPITRPGSDVPPPAAFVEPPVGPSTETDRDLWLDDQGEFAPTAVSYTRPHHERPAGSRRGGALLLGGIGAVVVVVVVLLVTGAFSASANKPGSSAGSKGSSTVAKTGSKSDSSSSTAKYLTQINLHAPDGAKKPAGIVQVVQETLKGKLYKGIVVYADGVTPNTKQNAYAVWLSNPGGASHFIGFDPKLVGKTGELQTEGELPKNATDYKEILVTLETSAKPTKPGTVILSGAFTETPKK